jgi:hypothetical protein
MKNRRNFIQQMAAGVTAATLIPLSGAASTGEVSLTGALIHHVFFWLKEPENQAVRKRFEVALRKLLKVKTIKMSHIGIPASTEKRDVVDHSYTYSYLVIFDSREDQESYQVDPIHQKFVEENSQLWSKVIVYDSLDL